MRDYAKDLFEPPPPASGEAASTRNYARDIFEEKINRDFEKQESTSAVTGKPEVKFTGEGGPGASFIAHLKAGFVDDPVTKVRIYAADRFPEMDETERMGRYKIQKGEVIYKGLDDKWYSEEPEMLAGKAKKFIAEITGDPSVLLGTAGEVAGGPLGAAVGAAAGEGIRRAVGNFAFDEPQSTVGNIAGIGAQGALGLVGSLPGRGVAHGMNAAGRRLGGSDARRVADAAGRDLVNIDFSKAAALKAQIKEKYGVDLFDAQTTESRRLIDKINLYGDLPSTADLVQSAKRIQDEQSYTAVKNFFNELAPNEDPLFIGKDLTEAAKGSIEREVQKRVTAARPHYEKAFSEGVKVDIDPHIQQLDGLIEKWPQGSPERGKLMQFRKMLFRDENVNGKILQVPQADLETLDLMKKSVDSILKPSASDAPVDTSVKRDIRMIKNNILEDMKKASPDYERGLAAWADTQEAFDEVAKKTRLAGISNLEGEQVVNATRNLFRSVGNSPEVMRRVKARIVQENPQAWDAAVRNHLEDIFNSATEATEQNASKVFNNFWRKTVGSPKEREILEVAMGGQYKNLQDFADMLRRVGLVGRRESTTATRQISLAEEQWYGKSKAIAAATRPLMTYQRIIGDKLNDFLGDAAKKRLMEAMLNPKTSQALQRVKVLNPNTQKGMQALSTFVSLVLGGEYTRGATSFLQPAHKQSIEPQY